MTVRGGLITVTDDTVAPTRPANAVHRLCPVVLLLWPMPNSCAYIKENEVRVLHIRHAARQTMTAEELSDEPTPQ